MNRFKLYNHLDYIIMNSLVLFQSEKPGHPGNIYSNWYPAEFTMPERTYNCGTRSFQIPAGVYISTEQGMMQAKALCFNAENTAARIMTPYPPGIPSTPAAWADWHKYQAAIKRLGGARFVPDYDNNEWAAVRFEVVKDLNREKFWQNQHLMLELLATGDSILAEAAAYDKIWGIGLSRTNSRCQNPAQWRGQNLLGQLLMDIRSEFQDIQEN